MFFGAKHVFRSNLVDTCSAITTLPDRPSATTAAENGGQVAPLYRIDKSDFSA
jgi:hypothetical protein